MSEGPREKPGNFVRDIELEHNASGRFGGKVITHFPPEPNGYLHIGHAKAICIDFRIAQECGGRCHLRFGDTNRTKEGQEYADSIIDTVRWLSFDWVEHRHVQAQAAGAGRAGVARTSSRPPRRAWGTCVTRDPS